MALTGPLTSALTGPLTGSLTGTSVTPVTTRLFAIFDGTDDFVSIPTMTATGDFEVSIEFSASVDGTQALMGTSADTQNNIIILANGVARVRISNNALDSTSGAFDLNVLNTLDVVRVGMTLTISVNGILVGTKLNSSGTLAIDRIGTYSTGVAFFTGPLAKVDFISGWTGTATNPTYPLDDTDNTAINSANPGTGDGTYNNFEVDFADRQTFTLVNTDWIGPELVTNGDFATDSDWVKGAGWSIAGGEAVGVNIDSGGKVISQADVMVDGAFYALSYTGTVDSGSLIVVSVGESVIPESRKITTSVTSVDVTFTSTDSQLEGKRFAPVPNGTLDNISVKQILGTP